MKKKMLRWIAGLMTGALCIGLLSGCGGSSSGTATSTAASTEEAAEAEAEAEEAEAEEAEAEDAGSEDAGGGLGEAPSGSITVYTAFPEAEVEYYFHLRLPYP